MAETNLDEPVLPDDYPVYKGYTYIADNSLVTSDIQGDVKRLKTHLNAAEIRRCDLAGRLVAKTQRKPIKHDEQEGK